MDKGFINKIKGKLGNFQKAEEIKGYLFFFWMATFNVEIPQSQYIYHYNTLLK